MSRRIEYGVASPQETVPGQAKLMLGDAPLVDTSQVPGIQPDDYVSKLAKAIPAEVIALYLGVINAVPVKDPSYKTAVWTVAAVTALCTPLYMYLATREAGKPTSWPQIWIATGVFPIWVYATGGPFTTLSWYEDKHWVGAIVLSFVTFLAAAYRPGIFGGGGTKDGSSSSSSSAPAAGSTPAPAPTPATEAAPEQPAAPAAEQPATPAAAPAPAADAGEASAPGGDGPPAGSQGSL